MYITLNQSLPQVDWRSLVPEPVMQRFAASPGGAFPLPTYSDGAAALVGGGEGGAGGTAVLLLGDSLHCFPPDLGQVRFGVGCGVWSIGGGGRGEGCCSPCPEPSTHIKLPPTTATTHRIRSRRASTLRCSTC